MINAKFDRTDCATDIKSTISAWQFIIKDFEMYLAYILDTKVLELKIEQVPIPNEFNDVFP